MSKWGQRSGSHLSVEVCGNHLAELFFFFLHHFRQLPTRIEIEREKECNATQRKNVKCEMGNSFGINKIAYDLFIIMCNYVDAYKLMTLQLGGGDNNNNDADYRKTQFYEATATTTSTATTT